VLKNPFNRSTSSLAQAPLTVRKGSVAMSPTNQRAPTPGSSEHRNHKLTKSKSHSYGKSQHSQSGSIFFTSENGSDLGHGNPYTGSPPPVPRVPNGFGYRNETSPSAKYEDKIVIDPRTPSDYALHAVFMRFATSAEMKIDVFLRQPLVRSILSF
jgi:hypothetical protein